MICEKCEQPIYRQRFVAGEWIGVDCGCAKADAIIRSTANPYSDLTLDHIYNEKGEKVRVTSVHQLREAEKRYEFSHHVANHYEKNWDTPKQQQVYQVGDRYRRKFAAGR
jgi:hypothetical protein